ncbi:hypothetical protein [Chryseobacterium takakiae]|uniref:Uncharacterized protein n=1 Tax=Chryseobacterium takakiae TaxID=1302685 RepID=A0A1M4ZX06_9FLAO|nr:hypothetical protein [Chryseobacterium takakiae]SHF22494.1 hypothetical protein SAMN05444408_11159 [Chryseobacterium takakiae]
MMKKKKTDFEARFWSGSRKHSAVGLLEVFFQFNNLTEVKQMLSSMMHNSVQKKSRTRKDPAELFQLYLSLRSLVRASFLISKKAKKAKLKVSSEINFSKTMTGSLSEQEYQNPVEVFRSVFKICSLRDFDEFLSAVVYFSLGNSGCDEEKKIIIPYLQLTKMLDAAWLIVERLQRKSN